MTWDFPPSIVQWLSRIPDFRRGYELTPELIGILHEVGIEGEFGDGGLRPEQWPEFGPVQKTLAEFKGAYDTFRDEVVKQFMDLPGLRSSRGTPSARTGARRAG
jgi:hypothetical protein